MKTSDRLRRQITGSLAAQHTKTVADAAIGLWEQMAAEIILIVGEDGFNSLYARSVILTRSTFPWLAANSQSAQSVNRFSELKSSLEAQTPAQAREANSLLLITFVDILASLIGEDLMSNILRLAWGRGASDSAGKELKNE